MNASSPIIPPRLRRRPARCSGSAARARWRRALPGSAASAGRIRAGRARHGVLRFPADHGPHPDFRIEWWYVTANLDRRRRHGLRRAMDAVSPGDRGRGRSSEGWANQQIWMGHAAVTRADTHRFAETFARGGIGQAGVEATPFHAWIDAWEMRGRERDERRRRCRRSTSPRRAPISATRCGSTPSGRWCCRATPATAANPSAARPRITTASRISRRTARSRIDDKPDRGHRAGLDGPRMEQPAAGVRPDRLGLVLAASRPPARS